MTGEAAAAAVGLAGAGRHTRVKALLVLAGGGLEDSGSLAEDTRNATSKLRLLPHGDGRGGAEVDDSAAMAAGRSWGEQRIRGRGQSVTKDRPERPKENKMSGVDRSRTKGSAWGEPVTQLD